MNPTPPKTLEEIINSINEAEGVSESDRQNLQTLIAEECTKARQQLCKQIVTDFNNVVADFQNDKDIDRHEFVVGLLWGVVARYEAQLKTKEER